MNQAQGAAQWVSEGRRHPDKLAGRLALVLKADVAIFDYQGAVLGDSSERGAVTAEESSSPEVVAAMRGEVGAQRASSARPARRCATSRAGD